MKKVTLYKVYSELSDEYIKFSALQQTDPVLSEQDFNLQMNKSKFVLRRFVAQKRTYSDEKLQETSDLEADETETETESEVVGGGKKIEFPPDKVEVILVYCRVELFLKSDNYKKLKSALKSKNVAEKEVIIIYENQTKMNNVQSLISAIGSTYYAMQISVASFISFQDHIYAPSRFRILSKEEREKEFTLLHIKNEYLSEISYIDPLVVFLRAHAGDVISLEHNSMNSGLLHIYVLVKNKV